MKLAVVTDAPRATRNSVTEAYTDRLLDACAKAAGIGDWERADVTVLEAPVAGGKQPPVADVRKARAGFLQRLEDARPDRIISFGVPALQALHDPSQKKLPTMKGEHGRMRLVELPSGVQVPWTPTILPYQVIRHSDLHRDVANVAYKVFKQAAPLPPVDVQVTVARTPQEVRDALEGLEGATVVGVDVETTGLEPFNDQVLALGIGAVSPDASWGYAVVVPQALLALDEVRDDLWDAVWRQTRRSVGHNFKFDMQFLAPLVGWAPREALIGDTLLLAHLLDERPNAPDSRARGSGLKDLVAQRYDYQYGFDFGEFYAQDESARDYDAMHLYLGDDVVYTSRLWHDLVQDVRDEGSRVLDTHDTLLVPVSRTVARAELTGAPLDVEWIRETCRIIAQRVTRRTQALEAAVAALTSTVVVDNVLSPTQVADMMYGDWGWTPDVRKHGKVEEDDRSTDKSHVEAAVEKYRGSADILTRRRVRWMKSLIALRRDVKTLALYEKQVLGKADTDGRIRASFLLHGAATGRISSRQPNLQNVPAVDREGADKKRPMRRAFAPGPGRVWVEVDYSQLELRVAAAISGDVAFGDVFRQKRDIHMEVACSIFSKTPDQVSKGERFIAKSVSFGILYGRGAPAIATGREMAYAERELGMKAWTVEQADAFIKKFLRSYPELSEWITRLHAEVPVVGYVESPFGRRRRFPMQPSNRSELGSIQRQAVNTPVQSAASDICLSAMTRVAERIEQEGLRAAVLFPVHDSVCIECDERDIEALEAVCRAEMEVDFMNVPLTVDFEYGPSWAETKAH